MIRDRLAQQIATVNDRVTAMYKQIAVTPRELPCHQRELLTAVFEELYVTVEELQVTQEQLRQQNAQLRQQNEELAAIRQIVEAERQRYYDLFELAPDAYLVTDAKGIIREANRAATMLLNVPQKFLVDKPLDIFLTESERRAFPAKISHLRQVSRAQEWEMCVSRRRAKPLDVAITVAPVRNQSGKLTALRWLLRDISLRKQAESQLLHNAFHDALTDLPNRTAFMNRLERAVEYAKRHKDYVFAVLFLDLDRFKVINDSLGHLIGDQLLIAIARRLKACLRPTDTPARLGGDEFTILLEGLKEISDALQVAERIQKELTLPFALGGQEVFTTTSIGIALSTLDYKQPEELLRDADIAMYRAKVLGKARYEIFNPNMYTQAVARLQLETALRRAIERMEFRIHYQPIVSLETGRINGFEALLRWQHPKHGLLCPAEFISVAQETGLIIPIDRWVFAQACRQTQQWQEQFPENLPLTISINLCSQHFRQPDLIKYIDQILQKTGLDAHRLKLEITEDVIMENAESATTTLEHLRSLGVQLCIDDFGTGYSSLGRLHRFAIDVLKIDRSFVSRIGIEQGNLEITETIVTLAQKLGVDVTAEGVETKEQLAQLKKLTCKYGQGYFFSQPLEEAAAEALIVANPQW